MQGTFQQIDGGCYDYPYGFRIARVGCYPSCMIAAIEWCETHIGERGDEPVSDWDSSFDKIMFLDAKWALLFKLTWA